MSYVVYHWPFEWGGVSESFCDSDMCRPWLVSVTLGVDYSLVNWEISRGVRNIFSRHRCRNLPEVSRPPPPLLFTFKKHDFEILAPKIKISAPNSNILCQKITMWRKIQISQTKFKSNNFCTTKNLSFSTRKTPNPTDLTHSPPTIGVSKKLEWTPLEKYLRVYPSGISPTFIRNKDRNNWRQESWNRRRQDQVRRALREAWHKSLKHWDIDCE